MKTGILHLINKFMNANLLRFSKERPSMTEFEPKKILPPFDGSVVCPWSEEMIKKTAATKIELRHRILIL
jgi:hypothetical protein